MKKKTQIVSLVAFMLLSVVTACIGDGTSEPEEYADVTIVQMDGDAVLSSVDMVGGELVLAAEDVDLDSKPQRDISEIGAESTCECKLCVCGSGGCSCSGCECQEQ